MSIFSTLLTLDRFVFIFLASTIRSLTPFFLASLVSSFSSPPSITSFALRTLPTSRPSGRCVSSSLVSLSAFSEKLNSFLSSSRLNFPTSNVGSPIVGVADVPLPLPLSLPLLLQKLSKKPAVKPARRVR
mmetsp:Transcript_26678/g.48995  ORF Transcript_26678/g.48995 Transcript_26678/m.48995 type:complete len:130 (-) Transcript_26678:2239-2628(-)